LYSLNVVSFSAGVTVKSSEPSELNGVHATLSIVVSSSEPTILKNTFTLELDLTFEVNRISSEVDEVSNTIDFVQYTAAVDVPVGAVLATNDGVLEEVG